VNLNIGLFDNANTILQANWRISFQNPDEQIARGQVCFPFRLSEIGELCSLVIEYGFPVPHQMKVVPRHKEGILAQRRERRRPISGS
jgi:hypothetical protein